MDKAKDLQTSADKLARETEKKLTSATYRMLLGLPADRQKDSDWALVIVGAVLALIFPRIPDLLKVYSLLALQFGIAMLLVSALAGLAAKSSFREIEKARESESEMSKEWLKATSEHFEKRKQIEAEAETAGVKIEDSLDWGKMFEPFKQTFPGHFPKVAEEIEARERDIHRQWKEPVKTIDYHRIAVNLQITILVAAFVYLLLNLHAPKSP